MTITDRQAAIAELRQCQSDAKLKLNKNLTDGVDTQMTRKEITEFERRLEAEIAELHIDHEQVRRVRADTAGKIIDRMCADISADISKKMAPLAPPTPIKGLK